jgi:hypothetical protein
MIPIVLPNWCRFLQTQRRQTDSNQAEDFPPLVLRLFRTRYPKLNGAGKKRGRIMNPLTQSKNTTIPPILIALTLACFALAPQARATCQQGCVISTGNTFLGDDALINNTTGVDNTATGSGALFSNTFGTSNTANGAFALFSNTTGFSNTATGLGALNANTTGSENTARRRLRSFQQYGRLY